MKLLRQRWNQVFVAKFKVMFSLFCIPKSSNMQLTNDGKIVHLNTKKLNPCKKKAIRYC